MRLPFLRRIFPAMAVPDVARLPSQGGAGTASDADAALLEHARWALADAARIAGRPIEAARAVAAVEYMAGALSANPRWAHVSPLVRQEMILARGEVRAALGVPAQARSQEVVDGLFSAADALNRGDAAGAERALPPLVFSCGPQRTLAILSALPPLPVANRATMRAAAEAFPGGGG